jgi:hypothetical protein
MIPSWNIVQSTHMFCTCHRTQQNTLLALALAVSNSLHSQPGTRNPITRSNNRPNTAITRVRTFIQLNDLSIYRRQSSSLQRWRGSAIEPYGTTYHSDHYLSLPRQFGTSLSYSLQSVCQSHSNSHSERKVPYHSHFPSSSPPASPSTLSFVLFHYHRPHRLHHSNPAVVRALRHHGCATSRYMPPMALLARLLCAT